MNDPGQPLADVRAEIRADLSRVADRLRGAPELRVEAAAPTTRAVLQQLADLAQGVDERAATTEPSWRAVPELPTGALGDQLAVLGADLTSALGDVGGDSGSVPVWTRGGRQVLTQPLARLAADLRALRMAL